MNEIRLCGLGSLNKSTPCAFMKKMKINGKHIMWTWITQHKSLERVFFTMYEILTIIVEEEYHCKRSYILVSSTIIQYDLYS